MTSGLSGSATPPGTHLGSMCRLETVLYSLTGCTRELLQLRQPCAVELQVACAWASASCSKPAAKAAPNDGASQ